MTSGCALRVGRALLAFCLVAADPLPQAVGDEQLQGEADRALQKSVEFFVTQVASHGGYVYTYSDDLAKREGEGKTSRDTVWVQPPGTPAVGLAYLEAYECTGQKYLLDAARSAAECLIRGQLRSGGWSSSIDFDEAGRQRSAYRVDPERRKIGSNWTTFDDNKTQSALTFLMRLDQALKFRDAAVHEAAQFALDSLLKAQYPNGAWPQGYQAFPDPQQHPVKRASFPDEYPRTYPGLDYRSYYTFNDNALADTIELQILASRIYREPKYFQSAIRAGEFILLAQLPDPQPAWAQQYDFQMHPAWARKFEPPAVSGGESQGVLRVLLTLYRETGEKKFLAPVEPALDYLKRSRLPDGRLARFYELRTNKPLYFTRQYELTYDGSDVPTHYGFVISANLERIQRDYERLRDAPAKDLAALRQAAHRPRSPSAPADREVRTIIAALDARGAWVEDGRLRYHGDADTTRRVIETRTFIRNITALSRFAGAASSGK